MTDAQPPKISVEGIPLHAYFVRVETHLREALSPLPPDWVQENGLPRHAIVGVFTRPAPKRGRPPRNSFWENPDFVSAVHDIVATRAATHEALRVAAAERGEGWVYVLDERASPGETHVSPEDVIGGFPVERGAITPRGYRPNPEWRLMTDRGPTILPPYILEEFLTRLS